MSEKPNLVLLSHHKCATNWLRSICQVMEEHGVITSQTLRGMDKSSTTEKSSSAANVLINVNASRQTTAEIDFAAQPTIHIVRDPRDAFVSNYWSWLKSHSNNGENILKFRERTQDLPTEEGMLILLDYFPMGKQLKSWTDEMWDRSIQFRYEDMLYNLPVTLRAIFANADIEIPDDVMDEIVDRTSFSKMAQGRKPGEEDVGHHFRKGVAGDWANYFTPTLKQRFDEAYGWMGPRMKYWMA